MNVKRDPLRDKSTKEEPVRTGDSAGCRAHDFSTSASFLSGHCGTLKEIYLSHQFSAQSILVMQKTLSGTLESMVDLVRLQRTLSPWRPGHGPLDVLELTGASVSVQSAAGAERSRLVRQRDCQGSPNKAGRLAGTS